MWQSCTLAKYKYLEFPKYDTFIHPCPYKWPSFYLMWTFVFKLGSMAPLLWSHTLCACRMLWSCLCHNMTHNHQWLIPLTLPLEGHVFYFYFLDFIAYLAHSGYLKIYTEWVDKGMKGIAGTEVLAFHCHSFNIATVMEQFPSCCLWSCLTSFSMILPKIQLQGPKAN